jgi:hypothetical protein
VVAVAEAVVAVVVAIAAPETTVVTIAEAIIAVPVTVASPFVALAVPIGVVSVVTTLAFAVQIVAPVKGLVTEVAVVFDGVAQPRFGALDAPLAASAIVCLRARRCGEKAECSKQDCHHGYFFAEFRNIRLCFQGLLLTLSTTLNKMPALVLRAPGSD